MVFVSRQYVYSRNGNVYDVTYLRVKRLYLSQPSLLIPVRRTEVFQMAKYVCIYTCEESWGFSNGKKCLCVCQLMGGWHWESSCFQKKKEKKKELVSVTIYIWFVETFYQNYVHEKCMSSKYYTRCVLKNWKNKWNLFKELISSHIFTIWPAKN